MGMRSESGSRNGIRERVMESTHQEHRRFNAREQKKRYRKTSPIESD